LHRAPIVPEKPTTAQMIVDETRSRCERLRRRWPVAAPIIEPLMAALQETLVRLDAAEPAPVHGDLASGQFLWTGERLVLLDLDMFGYADPAYDVGHFLAQLERRCLSDPPLQAHASRWLACFRDSYLAQMPAVSPRNVTFYQGLTLVRKIYTICCKQTAEWPLLAPQLALRARAALQEAASPA
jgi:aminoglycoside phosphotransferase (APT) family kinase protein